MTGSSHHQNGQKYTSGYKQTKTKKPTKLMLWREGKRLKKSGYLLGVLSKLGWWSTDLLLQEYLTISTQKWSKKNPAVQI